jgi:hypothetical protein
VIGAIAVIFVLAIETVVMNGNAALTVLNLSIEGEGRNTVVVLLVSVVDVFVAINYYGISDRYAVIVIIISLTSVSQGVLISYDSKSALGAYSRIYAVIYAVVVGIRAVGSVHRAIIDRRLKVSAVSASASVELDVVI